MRIEQRVCIKLSYLALRWNFSSANGSHSGVTIMACVASNVKP